MPKVDVLIETLIQQLHGEDWLARCEAARLLGQSRDRRAVDALLPDLKDADWRVRRNAAQALGALRDPRAVEPLLEALKDRTMTVRQRAIVALGRIKDVRALPALLDIVLANRHESYDAARAVRKFGKKALPDVARAFERTNDQELMMLLVEMKYEGTLDLLLKLMESDEPSARVTAIRELGKLGNEKAIPYLTAELQHGDPAIQSEAVQALGRLGAVETIPAMLGLLKDDELYGPYSTVYHAVTEAFQVFGGIAEEIKNAFPGTYPTMNMGGAPISLPEAMGLLGNLEESNPLKGVMARLQNGSGAPVEIPGLPADLVNKMFEDIRWKFGVMLADAKDARQDRVTRLTGLLASDSSLQRAAAALSLVWYADKGSVERLKLLSRDPDETVRTTAAWALAALQKALLYRNQFGM